MNANVAVRAIKYVLITLAVVTLNNNINIMKTKNVNSRDNVTTAVEQEDFILTNVQDTLVSVISDYDIESFLEEKDDEITFFCKAFGIKKKYIVNKLTKLNEGKEIKENNIGRLKNSKGKLRKFGSFEKGLIEYLFYYAEKNPSKVSDKYVPYDGDASYVEDLIKYYTSIYKNVDYLTAVSIGAAESGYYEVKYMLNYNNVYGGMGSNGLIRHKNIEYGVLSYIRMLSKYYYGKGLDTVEAIGKVYCPKKVNGVKVASPHWVKLVNKAKKHYKNSYEELTVMDLKESKSAA